MKVRTSDKPLTFKALALFFALLPAFEGTPVEAAPVVSVTFRNQPGAFPLATQTKGAAIVVSESDFPVAKIAANCLSEDIQKVTGFKPTVTNSVPSGAEAVGAEAVGAEAVGAEAVGAEAVFLGTLGKSPLIDAMVASKKIDASRIRGQWESYLIATVQNPVPGVKQGLVLVGSDRRGTAFAAFTLSQSIGVSPWNWWADVTPKRQSQLFVRPNNFTQGSPAVKYRGIFINDEDWGLQPWSAKTFEPEVKDIGPKTYAKVCELLLRLRANYLWPAMHPSTKAFNHYPENKVVADNYAIVMGASHAEPMLRNNVDEWDSKTMGPWNYSTNRDRILKYWEDRVAENGKYENLYTVGMRGIHDSSMEGGGSMPEKVAKLEQVIKDQRELLAKYVNPKVEQVPQALVPYKEVLSLYQNGLKVPEDVTLIWVDDNHGYIRQLSTPEEQKRSGGAGVYYHISYWGEPRDYLWLDSTSPALMKNEMTKAYDYGARNVWVVNVGDIKPQEIGLDMFLDLAWDVEKERNTNQLTWVTDWARRTFGPQDAKEIGAILNEYYRLNSVVRPEHVQRDSGLSFTAYGDEAQLRMDELNKLLARTNALYERTAPELRDGLYQLVVYPVRGTVFINEKVLHSERSRLYAQQGRVSANAWGEKARQAFQGIERETDYYNNKMAGGKWAYMMDYRPRGHAYFNLPLLGKVTPTAGSGIGVAVEGSTAVVAADGQGTLPNFNPWLPKTSFVDVFDTGAVRAAWTARPSEPWITVSQKSGVGDARLMVNVDWDKAPKTERARGTLTIVGAGMTRTVVVPTYRPTQTVPKNYKNPVQISGVAAFEAEKFNRAKAGGGAKWQVVESLGRNSEAVTVFPVTTPSLEPTEAALARAPMLEYDFQFFTPGPVNTAVFCSPTQRIHAGRGLRYAIAINDEKPQIVDLQAEEYSDKWRNNILRNTAVGKATLSVAKAGPQTLKIWMVDPGVVLDKITVSVGEPLPSFIGPPPTVAASK